MGSMSASDAAPLPRLGEVYFDVRGESRSMRLSWYADTGVAVFSIWQGGTCTGTFRLPIADLPRMIEALQRGPQTDAREAAGPHDDPRATELHSMPGQQGRTGHGAGHASGQYGPGDYGPGDSDRTERLQRPDHDLAREPGTGYSDPGFPPSAVAGAEGYGRTGAHGRYEETRAVYPDEGLHTGHGGYREERGDRYGDEPPTGVYRGDPLEAGTGAGRRPDRHGGRQDDPLSADYRPDPHDGGHHDDPRPSAHGDDPLSAGYRDDLHDGGGHHDDPRPSAYGDDPLSAGYRDDLHDGGGHHDDPLSSGYGDDPLGGGYADEPRGGPYRADSLTGGYRADLRSGHHDDPLSASYADEPRGRGRRADRHGDDYPDDPLTRGYHEEGHAGGYPEDPHGGHPGDPRGGYAGEPVTARYRAEPPTGDYPTGPSDPAFGDPDYPAPTGNAGYSPARPYVAPVPSGPSGIGEGRGRRAGGDPEEGDPSAGSFPYGRPPAEPEVRGRRR
jgi:hypothetical protein